MKNIIYSILIICISNFLFTSCQTGSTDEDIQQRINTELKKDNAGAALNATVDKGVATITGECDGAGCSAKVAERIKKSERCSGCANKHYRK